METPNTWSARDRSREASNDYYEKTPLEHPSTGYTDGTLSTESDYCKDEKFADQSSSVYESIKGDTKNEGRNSTNPTGIKSEDSLDGYLASNNPAYNEPKNK